MKALKYIELQPRDVLLFKRLCQFGYLTTSHINEFVFPSASYRTTCDRLQKLRQHGFIRKIRRRDEEGSIVYLPVVKSIGPILNESFLDLARRADTVEPWFTKTAEHDDIARSIALKIMAIFPQSKVELDFHLSASSTLMGSHSLEERRKLPDLFVSFDGGRTVSIEVELTNKSPARYQAILERYNWSSNNAVVYIYRQPETLDAISTAVEAVTEISGPLAFPLFVESLEKTVEPEFVERILNQTLLKLRAFPVGDAPHPVRKVVGRRMLSEIIQ